LKYQQIMINDHNMLKKLTWITDYEVTRIKQSDDLLTHFALLSYCDPVTSEDVIKEIKCQKLWMMELISLRKAILEN
jgi:hypothetical protein